MQAEKRKLTKCAEGYMESLAFYQEVRMEAKPECYSRDNDRRESGPTHFTNHTTRYIHLSNNQPIGSASVGILKVEFIKLQPDLLSYGVTKKVFCFQVTLS